MFSHANLCRNHVFVRQSTGKIAGIIDWEMTGWWRGRSIGNILNPRSGIDACNGRKKLEAKVFNQYSVELRVERILHDF